MMTQLNSGERMIEYKLELEANEIQLNTIEVLIVFIIKPTN